jgi:pimeloyl-ACP methyl ester carboxylesterase
MVDAREPERLAPRLHEIAVPVRLVVGAVPHEGGISDDQVRLLAADLPGFALDSVPAAGHYLFEEAPDAVVAAIRRTDQSARAVPLAQHGGEQDGADRDARPEGAAR